MLVTSLKEGSLKGINDCDVGCGHISSSHSCVEMYLDIHGYVCVCRVKFFRRRDTHAHTTRGMPSFISLGRWSFLPDTSRIYNRFLVALKLCYYLIL